MNLVASMDLNAGILVDVVLLAIIVWKLISGIRNGAVRMIGGLVSLGCGIYAGGLIRNLFAETVAQRWLVPAIRNVLDTAMNRLGLADIPTDLRSILDESKLPGFLKLDVLEQAAERIQEYGATAVTNATELIAQRIAGWLLFIIGLLVVTLLVRLLFRAVLEPLIDQLPLVGSVNHLLGGILGGVFGILIAGLLLCVCSWLLPGLWDKAGEIFSAETVRKSLLMKLYYQLLPGVFRG
jgi:uncharacterized membrane protein required for colicin V production